ncbi:hypothetical protein FTW_0651 [Francisella tularensis subsp. tularensis WY96-3418]|nr:hypothetical protein FTW_0651 [Francisella tularensis subsp. tularensis WY96-3418]ADA78428.1 hypothetical protein NE061598_04265 [Francisella tularensis subsp. tularensis NE061598]AKE20853.1 hypothetical protein RO31_0851 [Francisella tularensis subsp. tularensis str. SCHU S4 substr. NR-28534]EKM87591.1 hypothetical protein B344_03159 [Francisella tularensis subsp. tularensis 831]EKM87716.1 hypothetical protein B345_03199 [Francisella tularensis subsp. tularensis AS_713]EKM88411.1 hypotheti
MWLLGCTIEIKPIQNPRLYVWYLGNAKIAIPNDKVPSKTNINSSK